MAPSFPLPRFFQRRLCLAIWCLQQEGWRRRPQPTWSRIASLRVAFDLSHSPPQDPCHPATDLPPNPTAFLARSALPRRGSHPLRQLLAQTPLGGIFAAALASLATEEEEDVPFGDPRREFVHWDRGPVTSTRSARQLRRSTYLRDRHLTRRGQNCLDHGAL